MVRTAFRRLPHPAENVLLGPGGFKKQMAGFNVERLGNTARALACGRYAFTAARDYAATREQFDRPLCEFQACSGSSPTWRSSWRARSFCSIAPRPTPITACRRLTRRHRQSGVQSGRLRRGERGGADHGRHGIFPRDAGGILHAPHPRLDDRRRSVEILKNRIAEQVFDRRFDQRKRQPTAAE